MPLKNSGVGWVSWTGAPVKSSKVIEARHKFGTPDCGGRFSLRARWRRRSPPRRQFAPKDILGHDDIAPGRKADPGPAWYMSTFKAKVKGEAEDGGAVMAVHSPSGLNIRFGRRRCISSGQGDSPDGTKVLVHEASRKWRCVSVLDASGQPDFSGWVHGDWLVLA